MAKQKTYGTFSRDGVVMTARTAEDEVRFRYDGWTHVEEQAERDKAAAAAEPAAEPAASKSKPTK